MRLRSLFRRSEVEQELDQELQYHLEHLVDDHVAAGMSPREARYQALREMGGIDQRKEECRETRGLAGLDLLRQHATYALRIFRTSPGFVSVAILTLGLGIGASTTLFTIVRGVLLDPLPYRDADRLAVVIAEQDFEGARAPVRTYWQPVAVAAWPAQGLTFDRIGFYREDVAALAGPQTSELVNVTAVTGAFFETIDGQLAMGRGLVAADDTAPVAVISTRLWRRLYGGSPDALGRSLTLSGRALTVVGIVADTFQIPRSRQDIWIPAGVAQTPDGSTAILRVKAGVSLEAAAAEVSAIAARLAAEMPRQLAGVRVRTVRLHDAVVGDVRPALVMLTAAVWLLLVLACANVMNLLLARHIARSHQWAVMVALGASRGRLIAQSLGESAVLTTAGGIVGMGLTTLIVRAVQVWPPVGLPRVEQVKTDAVVILFASVVAAVSTFAVGLLPALAPRDWAPGLRASQHGGAGNSRGRGSLRAVTVAQLAISVVLLVGALLLGRSLAALVNADLGVAPKGVVTASLNLALDRTLTAGQQTALVARVLDRIAALPQVMAAGIGTARPPDASRVRLTLNRSDRPDARASFQAAAVPATPGYFRALDIRLERGRLFTEADALESPPVVILSAETARQLFGNEDPLGHTMGLPVLRDGRTAREEMTVVGIVSGVKYAGIDQMAEATVYRPLAQQPWSSVFLVARTSGDARALASQFRREIAAIDRAITVSDIATLDEVLADATAQPRLRTLVLGAFAVAAFAIAAVGLYGVVSYSVSRRTSEIGIRMALGADATRIRRMVLREGLVLACLGGILGLAGAWALARLLTSFLYGVKPTDAPSFALAATGVLFAGLAASYLPAARAARADPMVVLKAE